MGNLALTYSDLGRLEDALAMQERALEFYRCVLPEDHPDIGEWHVWSGVACGVVIVGRLFNWDLFTSRQCHEPTCLDVFCPLSARGCLYDARKCARVVSSCAA